MSVCSSPAFTAVLSLPGVSLFSLLHLPLLSDRPSPTSSDSSSSVHQASLSSLPSLHFTSTPKNESPIASNTGPTRRTRSSVSKRVRTSDQPPRPRNAFILFLADYREREVLLAIEKDQRLTNRVLGCLWRRLPLNEKKVYQARAKKEKMEHALKYPGYQYRPRPANQPKKKRNVKRNGPSDLKRCELIADLLLSGKMGDDLVEAVGRLDISVESEVTPKEESPPPGKDTDSISVGSETDRSPQLVDCPTLSGSKATQAPFDSGKLDVSIFMYSSSCLLIDARRFSLLPFNCLLLQFPPLLNRVNTPNISNAPKGPLLLKMDRPIPLR
jgi:hypothetical protein